MRKVVAHNGRLGPGRLGVVCTVPPSTLAVEMCFRNPREVHWWDFSKCPPKYSSRNSVTHTQQTDFRAMTFVQVKSKHLLVTVDKDTAGVTAYNADADEREWEVNGTLPGNEKKIDAHDVTTDGCGHLFVSDMKNNYVQIFSTEGVYMGSVRREENLHRPTILSWCSKNKQLVVYNQHSDGYISFVDLDI